MLFLTKAAKTGQIYCTRAIDSKDFKIKNLSKFCLRRGGGGVGTYSARRASPLKGGQEVCVRRVVIPLTPFKGGMDSWKFGIFGFLMLFSHVFPFKSIAFSV